MPRMLRRTMPKTMRMLLMLMLLTPTVRMKMRKRMRMKILMTLLRMLNGAEDVDAHVDYAIMKILAVSA